MWDEKYSNSEYHYGTRPNDFLAAQVSRIPSGRVLCLGVGEGRNAVFLAEQGYAVTGVDYSLVGLKKTRRLAADRAVDIEVVFADLADYDLGVEAWDGIISVFCHVPPEMRTGLHRRIVAALKPGGTLLLEAYTPDQIGRGTGGPPQVEWMVTAELLRSELTDLEFDLLHEVERDVREGGGHTGQGSVVQLLANKG